ncbi:PD-(D/E)XK motif protein [Demequina subtropica]|uniref:PD-(D/E)XK motif protein n=1 Tax=Demequina subtropica TaxID=1638989 RepID=UPI0007823B57|nr:PD-(D/E)XK motif protein [Demequina subtropica]
MAESLEDFPLEPAYEWLREEIVGLRSASGADARTLSWADERRELGIARDERGRLELFLVGARLNPANPVVKEALAHDVWTTRGGDSLEASRLLMPAAPHFDQVAAFICAELLNNGMDSDREGAFARTEAIIALALQKARLGSEFLIGLAGELLLLRALLAHAPAAAEFIIDAWKGAGRSSRDFQLANVGVEVKATTHSDAVHHIQGLHQIECGTPVDDHPETDLYLMSFGISWLDAHESYGTSLRDLVEAIRGRIGDPETRSVFDRALEAYGAGSGGPGSAPITESSHFADRFDVRFARLYDLTDPLIKLPTRDDLSGFEHMQLDSLSFRIQLPERVNGDLNPIRTLPDSASHLLARAGLLAR